MNPIVEDWPVYTVTRTDLTGGEHALMVKQPLTGSPVVGIKVVPFKNHHGHVSLVSTHPFSVTIFGPGLDEERNEVSLPDRLSSDIVHIAIDRALRLMQPRGVDKDDLLGFHALRANHLQLSAGVLEVQHVAGHAPRRQLDLDDVVGRLLGSRRQRGNLPFRCSFFHPAQQSVV